MMTETTDKYDDLAKTAGAAAGLSAEQIPGFAHILRELARSERAEQKEACARVAETKPFIQARDTDWDEGVNYARKAIAAAIRAME